jgi:pimeloyl-ACP methyl ester carboxylesterase
MSVLADDVAWLCTQLGVTGAVVVGHSMGAIVGIELTARHPQLVSALVLVEPGPIAPPPELAALLSGFVEAMSGPDPEAVRRDFVSKSLFLPSDDPVLKERVLVEMLAAPNHVALECFRGMATWPGETVIKAVGVPVLAVHADTSINEPERLAALCQLLRMPRRPEWVTSTTCSPRRRSTGSSNSSSARQSLVWPGTPVVTGGSPAEVLRCRVSFRRR